MRTVAPRATTDGTTLIEALEICPANAVAARSSTAATAATNVGIPSERFMSS
jgi:hypothetical protein